LKAIHSGNEVVEAAENAVNAKIRNSI